MSKISLNFKYDDRDPEHRSDICIHINYLLLLSELLLE